MTACLSLDQIGRFAAGDLSDDEAAACATHIAECQECAQAVETHRRDESMLELLRTDPTHSIGPNDQPAARPGGGVTATFPKIEGYRILGVLGQGGMGIVYRAVQTKLSRTVALKVLPAVVGTANPAAVERFKREATAAAQLHHTNIVPIYDFGESRDAYYYTMELIEGQPLDVVIKRMAAQNAPGTSPVQFAQLLKETTAAVDDFEIILQRTKTTPSSGSSGSSGSAIGTSSTGRGRAYYRQVARWMADAAEALQFAHDQGIIHRDIKPANFLITLDHRIMVADFGLAKTAGEQSVTKVGSLLGTLRYMSPEQAMAKRVHLDHRTDIYSLGVTMYELLTFRPAFPGDDEKEVLGSIIAREPTSARKIAPHVPHELETICFKAMEKLPDARYDTARALADDLRRWSNDLPIAAKPPGARVRVTKFLRRHRVATLAVAVSVLVLISAVLVVGLTREAQRRQAAEADQLVTIAGQMQTDGDLIGAQLLLESFLESEPGHVRALGTLAIVLKEQYRKAPWGQEDRALLEKSITVCESAIDRMSQLGDEVPDERRAGVYLVYAVSLYLADRVDDAERACDRALEYAPNNYNAWSNLAKIYVLQDRLDEALEAAQEGIQHIPDGPTKPYMAPVWRTLGTVHLVRREREAIAALEHAIAIKEDDAFSWILEARCYMDLEKDYAEALHRARTGERMARENRDPRVIRTLALAQLRVGQYEEAIATATTCPHDEEMQALTHLIIAVAHAHLGNTADAHSHLASSARSWPEHLRERGETLASVRKSVVWFDTADELIALRDEAESLIAAAESQP